MHTFLIYWPLAVAGFCFLIAEIKAFKLSTKSSDLKLTLPIAAWMLPCLSFLFCSFSKNSLILFALLWYNQGRGCKANPCPSGLCWIAVHLTVAAIFFYSVFAFRIISEASLTVSALLSTNFASVSRKALNSAFVIPGSITSLPLLKGSFPWPYEYIIAHCAMYVYSHIAQCSI